MSNTPTSPPVPPALSSAHAKTIAAATDPAAPSWLRQVALVTGILAALGGYLAVRSTNLSNEAIYHSNQGVLQQAKASDKWAEFQAASIKARIVETQLDITAPDGIGRGKLEAAQKDLRDRQPILMKTATDLELARDAELAGGQKNLDQKDMLGYAGMAVQLAIALASVAALTRRKVAYVLAIIIGSLGLLVTGYAIVLPHVFPGH